MAKVLITIIRIYQKTLSLDHGWFAVFYPAGFCRFQPTCSQYTIEALEEHGFWSGVFLGLTRVSRCHPWTSPGLDQIPRKHATN